MYLSTKEQKKTLKVIKALGQTLDSEIMRQSTGDILLDLLQSNQFASFVWDDKKKIFDKGVSLNMSEDNLSNYSNYYQKQDPITGKLMVRKSATRVSDIMPQQALMKTEFYNDFLSKDGLHYGINLHAYTGNKNIGDFRIWRKKGKENFDEKSVYILDLIKPYFCNAMRNILQHEAILSLQPQDIIHAERVNIRKIMFTFLLTKREAQITMEILLGYKDYAIATKLHIAFSTLRTHIKHIFSKLQVNNRSLLIHKVLSEL
jgi:DNA-binding CsgD family transcriptional regulator